MSIDYYPNSRERLIEIALNVRAGSLYDLHLILTHSYIGPEDSFKEGATLSRNGGLDASGADTCFCVSYLFVEKMKIMLLTANSDVPLKDYATRTATHELGHHRADLSHACKKIWDPYQNQWVYELADSHSDGDCTMASPAVIVPDEMRIYSACGSGRSITSYVHFCSKCQETLRNTSW